MMQTVLFQHGLGGDDAQAAANWPETADALRVTINCRGHKETTLGPDRPFSIPLFARDALMAMDGHDRFIAGGISMGAAISLYLACHHPARVTGLILARPAWSFTSAPANMAPIAEMAALLKRLPPDAARAEFSSGETGRRLALEAPDNLASLLGYADKPQAALFAEVLADIAAGSPGVTRHEVEALRLPTLIIVNDHDAVHPRACAETLAATIPGARLVSVVPKALDRHRHHHEVKAAIADFLALHARRTP
ncbi:alpha/beta fold hydrolase [Rhizobium sp. 9140]|uniref:alpha/beta fold hydrolase n=1 Tax=Rhizobium sp. 9140 TaxID=1761900 RepID=UPI00079268F9|nr:alpha/beta hydrolase [Rhizobium sp. 9140]CZT37034.1 Pimeloyl-ACP methyl ester carboxylesterase [Rhizobium sp. 9140]